uniref:Glycine-zipper containing OmpA-like membrane domain-containing protein n=1 Tax=Candidatus Kentrum sp. LPFa TaxID=2126335 RepID=A0A450WSC8_9GAMM|nr:MAG: Glycine-zipper containing OmpA-like membrane domain-containing protein [Candidatus Kentron sp. LPFa]VFK34122.1 MAG: Glycine-zipper containing OmpA-like membrane domain-containing protein [Candidatus Kentron sp. LPFa]
MARVSAVLLLGLFLAGCMPLGNVRQMYASDTSDPCNDHRQVLVKTKESFTKTILKGAAAGVVAGALIGFLSEGDLQGAVTGAVIGGAAGAVGGYFKARYDKAKTRQELIAGIRGDFATDNQHLDKAAQAVRGMTQCRRNQYETILADFKAGNVDRKTALARKDDIDFRIERDRELIALLLDKSEKRAQEYNVALSNGFELPPGRLIKKPTASAQSEYKKYIALKSVNVRPGPGKSSGAPVGRLTKGELVHVAVGHDADAWKPITRSDGTIAYVYTSLIAPENSEQAKQVLAKFDGKAKIPNVPERKMHDAAREKLRSGGATMLAMQQDMQEELLYLQESTTWLFRDEFITALLARTNS